jgi:hypothetical protein
VKPFIGTIYEFLKYNKLNSLDEDLNYLLNTYELFLEEVGEKLNQIHETNYSKNYFKLAW